ncbi:heat shock protein HtpX [Haloarcula vallismortis]|uniref:Heat shock protein HtpX n=1 Tax=Haloarcula vallismortis TaxID=28442 RepID=A0A1H2YYE2_HALVA|nr:M48 family metalloprotease [Haloarcula vallismortis]SDX10085.1 heat shock protein HtpX [Haloarcula vallismortis]
MPATNSNPRLRLTFLLLGLIAFDALAVAMVYVLAHVAYGLLPMFGLPVGASVWTRGFHLVPLGPVVLAGTPFVLALQFLFGYRVTLRETTGGPALPEAAEPETSRERFASIKRERLATRLRERVGRLARAADMPTPDVRVIDSATPNSYAASRPGEQTLFVTTALVDRLDDAELDAVLAHELAHLKNGDSFVMTAAAFLPIVSARAMRRLRTTLETSVVTYRFLDGEISSNAVGAAYFHLPLVAFALVALPLTAALYLASTACYRLLSRIREYAADAGGVAICGSPAALVSALEALTENLRPTADIRAAGTGVRELCVVPYAIADGTSDPPEGRAERLAHRWQSLSERLLPRSHPPVESRIAALAERQSALDQPERL